MILTITRLIRSQDDLVSKGGNGLYDNTGADQDRDSDDDTTGGYLSTCQTPLYDTGSEIGGHSSLYDIGADMQSPMRGVNTSALSRGAKGMELYDAGDNVFAPVIHKSVFVQRRRRVGPQDIGKRVEVTGRGMGVLMSFGPHHQTFNTVCGVKMDEDVGDHDGTVAVSCP